jgi:ABC-type lipoprotein release transport system permease subunit
MLFNVKPTDPLTYVAVAGLMVLVTLAASYVPARRASRIDPLASLRQG